MKKYNAVSLIWKYNTNIDAVSLDRKFKCFKLSQGNLHRNINAVRLHRELMI